MWFSFAWVASLNTSTARCPGLPLPAELKFVAVIESGLDPQAVSPGQGFLASANQQPIDPAITPTYLGADWYAPWRALRINQLLRMDSSVTVEDMRAFQTDPGSVRANLFVGFQTAYVGDYEHVPTTLAEARDLLAGSAVARAAFGDDVVDHYVNNADVELRAFEAAVTDWERFRGFERL